MDTRQNAYPHSISPHVVVAPESQSQSSIVFLPGLIDNESQLYYHVKHTHTHTKVEEGTIDT